MKILRRNVALVLIGGCIAFALMFGYKTFISKHDDRLEVSNFQKGSSIQYLELKDVGAVSFQVSKAGMLTVGFEEHISWHYGFWSQMTTLKGVEAVTSPVGGRNFEITYDESVVGLEKLIEHTVVAIKHKGVSPLTKN